MPIKAKRLSMNIIDTPSYGRKRIVVEKKVSEFKDGLKILSYTTKKFLKVKLFYL